MGLQSLFRKLLLKFISKVIKQDIKADSFLLTNVGECKYGDFSQLIKLL